MPLGKSPMTLWLPGLNSPTLSPFQSPPSSNQEISPLSALPTRLPAPLPPSWPHRFQFLLPIAPKRQPGHFFKILLRTGSSSVQTPGGSFLFNLIKSTSQPGTPAVSCPGSPLPASASGLPATHPHPSPAPTAPGRRACAPSSSEGSSAILGTAVPGASPVATSRVMAEVSRSTGRSMVLPSGVGVSVRLCDLSKNRSSWR